MESPPRPPRPRPAADEEDGPASPYHPSPRTPNVRPGESELSLKYKPGSIRRIRLKNFLTYSDVEFRPGPRLNIVMGPNGTGKSTILCAICLGLGGEPNLLGRGDDAREFIMHGREVAEIEIELSPRIEGDGRFGETHVIRRVIDRNKGSARGRGASTFHVNGAPTSKKDVKALVTGTYCVSVDNMCTFLPQDRVGSFSGLDGKALLVETEKSLSGSRHLYETHLKLIELEKEIASSGGNADSIRENLNDIEAEVNRLEHEKELMEEREAAMEQVKLLEQKRAWLLFDEAQARAVELKVERDRLRAELKEARRALRPLEERLAELIAESERTGSRHAASEEEMKRAARNYDRHTRKAEAYEDKIDSSLTHLVSIEELRYRREREAAQQRAKVEELRERMVDLPSEEEVEEVYAKATADMREVRAELTKIKREAGNISDRMKALKEGARKAQGKLDRMNDDRARRNERIFRQNVKLAQTFEWIDQNRKMFRRRVWGPIVCEIQTETADVSAFVEQHVPYRCLVMYVVECEEDSNLLYREVRQKRNLPINISIVPLGRLEPVRHIYSHEKMDMLKRDHGILGVLEDQFVVPDPVLQVLRNEASVHAVLVGSDKTQESIDKQGLMDMLSAPGSRGGRMQQACVFTKHMNHFYKYTNNVSRYSGKTSMRVDDISQARMLAPGVSEDQKAAAEREVEKLGREIEELAPKEEEINKRYLGLQEEGQEIQRSLTEAKTAKTNLKNSQARLANARRKLEELEEAAASDSVEEKNVIIADLKKYSGCSIGELESAAQQHTVLMKNTYTLAGIKMTEDGLTATTRRLKEKLSEKKAESSSLEVEVTRAASDLKDAKKDLADFKAQAEEIAPMTDELKAKLIELPASLEEVDAALEEAAEKVDSIHDNPEVLVQYEKRKRQLAQIRDELENLNETQSNKRIQLETIKKNWEQALVNTIEKVNTLFAEYMAELGCAGEVSLRNGGEQENNRGDDNIPFYNFPEWGIEIRVKFRQESKLQVLSARVQSGGERSVSTIMYLMALQGLMVCPFRCVDEINQGLDERNERLVFKRIVLNSTKPPNGSSAPHQHSGQYFLITPKLLPNLTDIENEDVTVLCILNGPYNFKHFSDWDVDKFLGLRKHALRDTCHAGNQLSPNEEEEEENERTSRGGGTPQRKKRKTNS